MFISAELNAPLQQNNDFWMNTKLKPSIASRQLLYWILFSQEVKYTEPCLSKPELARIVIEADKKKQK